MSSEGLNLDTVLFGSTTVQDIIIYVVAAAVAIAILRRLYYMIAGGPKDTLSIPGRCPSCKWSGKVSKFKAVCPNCGSPVQPIKPQ